MAAVQASLSVQLACSSSLVSGSTCCLLQARGPLALEKMLTASMGYFADQDKGSDDVASAVAAAAAVAGTAAAAAAAVVVGAYGT